LDCSSGLGGGGRGKENNREWIISKYIASAYEGSTMKHSESCWIVRGWGDRERESNRVG
jgi:hypothetical protein